MAEKVNMPSQKKEKKKKRKKKADAGFGIKKMDVLLVCIFRI